MSMETNEVKTVATPGSKNEMHVEPSTSTFVFNQCENLTVNNNCESVNDMKESLDKVMNYLKAKDDAKAKKEEMIFNLANAFIKPITEAISAASQKKSSTTAPAPQPTAKKKTNKKTKYKK